MKDADSGTFWEDEGTAAKCAEADWSVLENKRAFRKFAAKYDEVDVQATRALVVASYPLLTNAYRFYSVLGSNKPFVMQLNDFTKFLNDVQLVTSGDSADGGTTGAGMPQQGSPLGANITEDYCDTLFKQVNFSLPDPLTKDMERLNSQCEAYRIRKDYDLMRYEFVECILRLAQASREDVA